MSYPDRSISGHHAHTHLPRPTVSFPVAPLPRLENLAFRTSGPYPAVGQHDTGVLKCGSPDLEAAEPAVARLGRIVSD